MQEYTSGLADSSLFLTYVSHALLEQTRNLLCKTMYMYLEVSLLLQYKSQWCAGLSYIMSVFPAMFCLFFV